MIVTGPAPYRSLLRVKQMIGKALRESAQTPSQTVSQDAELESLGAKIDDGLQDSLILTNCRRSA